ncbi:MAG: tRNA-i(6)A37 methylthiotransferase, partial [uncultured Arthrobacter sp.]
DDDRPPHVRGRDLRLPDERARQRADRRPARRGGLRPGGRRRDRGRRRVQHLRRARERRQPAVRQPRPPQAGQGPHARHADRRRRLPGAEGPRGHHDPGAVGRRRLRHPQRRCAAGAARALARRAAQPGRAARGARGVPERAAGPPQQRGHRLGQHQRRVRQHLHVLHRAEPARRRGGPAAGRRPARGRGAGRAGRARGDAAQS